MGASDPAAAKPVSRRRASGAELKYKDRQMRSLLRRLSRRGAYMLKHPINKDGASGWWIATASLVENNVSPAHSSLDASATKLRSSLAKDKPKGARGAMWSSALVDDALSAGLIEKSGDSIRLSSSGAAYLRRALSDTGDSYAAQHQHRSTHVLREHGKVVINECESPLGWLRNRKDRKTGKPLISKSQFEAGERLRADYFRAQLSTRVTTDWSSIMSAGRTQRSGIENSVGLSDVALAAKERFYRALDAVGEDLSDVLVWVCCDSRGLGDIERAAGWPQRSGKVMLQTALMAPGAALRSRTHASYARLEAIENRPLGCGKLPAPD